MNRRKLFGLLLAAPLVPIAANENVRALGILRTVDSATAAAGIDEATLRVFKDKLIAVFKGKWAAAGRVPFE